MKTSGSHVSLTSVYTLLVRRSIASCDITCKCAMGIFTELGSLSMMKGSGMVVGLIHAERLCCGSPITTGFMTGGRGPGVLFLVLRWCVHGFAWSVNWAVGLVVVVIGGAAATLYMLSSPSEVGDWSTLWMVGVFACSLFNAASISFKFLLRDCLFNFWTKSFNSERTSVACWTGVNYGSKQFWGERSKEPDMR